MKVQDLIPGNEYIWTMYKGNVEVLTFDKLVESIFGVAQFTNGIILTERIVDVDVSEVQVWPPVPHVHAKEMIAFAKGHDVEVYAEDDGKWYIVPRPFWNLTDKYRIKKDNSGQIALLEKVVADLNEEIETRQVKKQGWLKCLQELQ